MPAPPLNQVLQQLAALRGLLEEATLDDGQLWAVCGWLYEVVEAQKTAELAVAGSSAERRQLSKYLVATAELLAAMDAALTAAVTSAAQPSPGAAALPGFLHQQTPVFSRLTSVLRAVRVCAMLGRALDLQGDAAYRVSCAGAVVFGAGLAMLEAVEAGQLPLIPKLMEVLMRAAMGCTSLLDTVANRQSCQVFLRTVAKPEAGSRWLAAYASIAFGSSLDLQLGSNAVYFHIALGFQYLVGMLMRGGDRPEQSGLWQALAGDPPRQQTVIDTVLRLAVQAAAECCAPQPGNDASSGWIVLAWSCEALLRSAGLPRLARQLGMAGCSGSSNEESAPSEQPGSFQALLQQLATALPTACPPDVHQLQYAAACTDLAGLAAGLAVRLRKHTRLQSAIETFSQQAAAETSSLQVAAEAASTQRTHAQDRRTCTPAAGQTCWTLMCLMPRVCTALLHAQSASDEQAAQGRTLLAELFILVALVLGPLADSALQLKSGSEEQVVLVCRALQTMLARLPDLQQGMGATDAEGKAEVAAGLIQLCGLALQKVAAPIGAAAGTAAPSEQLLRLVWQLHTQLCRLVQLAAAGSGHSSRSGGSSIIHSQRSSLPDQHWLAAVCSQEWHSCIVTFLCAMVTFYPTITSPDHSSAAPARQWAQAAAAAQAEALIALMGLVGHEAFLDQVLASSSASALYLECLAATARCAPAALVPSLAQQLVLPALEQLHARKTSGMAAPGNDDMNSAIRLLFNSMVAQPRLAAAVIIHGQLQSLVHGMAGDAAVEPQAGDHSMRVSVTSPVHSVLQGLVTAARAARQQPGSGAAADEGSAGLLAAAEQLAALLPKAAASEAAAAASGGPEGPAGTAQAHSTAEEQHACQLNMQALLPAATEQAAALQAHWDLPEQQAAARLELAQAAAVRSCAYLRCSNVAAEGGPAAGEGVGSRKCSACRAVWYCHEACSHADWRGRGQLLAHKHVCKELAAARQAQQQAQQQQAVQS